LTAADLGKTEGEGEGEGEGESVSSPDPPVAGFGFVLRAEIRRYELRRKLKPKNAKFIPAW
jgi:hypothetical protein